MKKFLFAAFAVLAFGAVNAQDFKAGVHVGLPIGTAGDAYSFNVGADVYYTWEINDKFSAGAMTGFSMYFGKDLGSDLDFPDIPGLDIPEIKQPNAGFLPIAATATYKVSDNIFIGADLGFAIGVMNASSGGLFYNPKVGYAAEKFDIFAGFRGISVTGGSLSTINLGVAFKL